MKINGKEIVKQGIETIVFPRRGNDLVFKAKPVTDFTSFDKLCPRPKAPTKVIPGPQTIEDVESPVYKQELQTWAEKRTAWMLKESLSATEGLTWDTINPSDSNTWMNFNTELLDSGLSGIELTKLYDIIMIACGLNQDKIEEATNRFLAGQAAQ